MDLFSRTDCINDSRNVFTNLTFSGYKKNQVIQQFEKSLINSQLEESCHWSVELIISGHYLLLFEILGNVYSKAININNPNFPYFFLNQFKKYLGIIQEPIFLSKPINLRNNYQIRHLFAELVLYLCLSKKTHIYSLPKIKKEELSIGNIKHRFKASRFYLQNIRKEKDHIELIEIGNELVMAIISANIQDSLYWVQWILTWEKTNKKKKIDLCHPRRITNINPKFENDVIWFLWTIIILLATKDPKKKQIMSLFYLYSYDYNLTKKYQKVPLLVSAIIFLIEKCDFSIPLTTKESQIKKGVDNIGYLYHEINEKSNPNANLIPPIINGSINQNSQTSTAKPKKKKKEIDNLDMDDSFQKLKLVDQIFNSTFLP